MEQDGRSYADYRSVAETLARSLRSVAALWDEFDGSGAQDDASRATRLRSMATHLESDAFNLMVVGEFKRGKSTLINAMLGRPILPAKIAPCTAVITQVRYSDKERATLFYANHDRAPLEIATSEIKNYVAIEGEDGESDQVRRREFERMDVMAPIDLCREGVSIVDSPGLNEDDTRTEVTRSFLDQADAMVLVLSCAQQFSRSEQDFIRDVVGPMGKDSRSIFVVWNNHDVIQSDDDEADLRARSRKLLEPHVGGSSRVFYVSARDGLTARKTKNDALLRDSGLVGFERGLEQFLAAERGALKLRSPLGALEQGVRDLDTTFERRALMLRASLGDLQRRYDEHKPRFKDLERQHATILKKIDRIRTDLADQITNSYVTLASGLQPKLRQAVKGVEIGWADIVWPPKREEVGKQLEAALKRTLADEQRVWSESSLQPMVGRRLDELADDLAEGVAKYVRDLEAVRTAVTTEPSVASEDDVGTLQRVLAGVGGFVLGGLGGAVMGGAVGFKGLMKGLGLHLTLMIGLLAFGVNPILGILLSVLSGMAGSAFQVGSMKDEMKDKLAVKFHEAIMLSAADDGRKISTEAMKQLDALRAKVDEALGMMLDEFKGQVEASLAELQRGQASVDRQIAGIEAFRLRAAAVGKELTIVRTYVGN